MRFGRDPFGLELSAGVAGDLLTPAVPLPDIAQLPSPSLNEWPVTSLRFLGVIGSDGLVAGGSRVYRVRVGERLGRDGGRVERIRASVLETDAMRLERAAQTVESAK